MKITFSPYSPLPQNLEQERHLTVSKSGDTLTINGEVFDFSGIPNGATLPKEAIACDWIAGPVERDMAGVLTIPLRLPCGHNAPEKTRFPQRLENVADGPVNLPPYTTEEEST